MLFQKTDTGEVRGLWGTKQCSHLSVQSGGDAGEGVQEAHTDLELLLKEEATESVFWCQHGHDNLSSRYVRYRRVSEKEKRPKAKPS